MSKQRLRNSTESKNWVKTESCAQCTQLSPACVHSRPQARALVSCRGLIWPCRGLQPAVAWPGPRPCRRRCVARLAGCVVALCSDTGQQPQAPSLSQYTAVYCDTKFPAQPSLSVTIHSVYCDPMPHANFWS